MSANQSANQSANHITKQSRCQLPINLQWNRQLQASCRPCSSHSTRPSPGPAATRPPTRPRARATRRRRWTHRAGRPTCPSTSPSWTWRCSSQERWATCWWWWWWCWCATWGRRWTGTSSTSAWPTCSCCSSVSPPPSLSSSPGIAGSLGLFSVSKRRFCARVAALVQVVVVAAVLPCLCW